MISVNGVDHLNLRVADLDRALRFYTGVLGLREVRRSTRPDGSVSLLALRAGNVIVFLQPSPTYAPPDDHRQSGLDHYSLEIEARDAQQLADHLRQRGVEIVEGPVTRFGAHGDGTSIYVRDPDGHRLELKQYNLRASGAASSS
jgi:catechol 2,3-dioxygenase-like lactoylglutathione lyase family enzyme